MCGQKEKYYFCKVPVGLDFMVITESSISSAEWLRKSPPPMVRYQKPTVAGGKSCYARTNQMNRFIKGEWYQRKRFSYFESRIKIASCVRITHNVRDIIKISHTEDVSPITTWTYQNLWICYFLNIIMYNRCVVCAYARARVVYLQRR